MNEKDFNEFYQWLLEQDEETINNCVLGMAKIVADEQRKKEIRRHELEKLEIRRERVM